MATFSTAVEISNRSALSNWANKLQAKSLSITAAVPLNWRSPRSITGMPPPPTAITITPVSTRALIGSNSTTSTGSGEATTRRQPRPASSTTSQPMSSARPWASAWSINPPIGLDGFLNAGSFRSTRTCVMTVATGLFTPRWRSSF